MILCLVWIESENEGEEPCPTSPPPDASAQNYDRNSPMDQTTNDFHYSSDHENEENCDDINIEILWICYANLFFM